MGNKKVNDFWEANLGDTKRPKPQCTQKERKHWINEKYILKTYCGLKCAELFVRNSRIKKKKYFIALDSAYVKFFESVEAQKAEEIILLQSLKVKTGHSATGFALITPNETYKIEAKSPDSAVEWANIISVVGASVMKQLTNLTQITVRNI